MNPKDIAKWLTEDPDIFNESDDDDVDEVDVDEKFEIIGHTHEQQKEPRDPGKETHKVKTAEGPEGEIGSKKSPYLEAISEIADFMEI